ncbi:MAG: DUF2281 domain-containing protein [Chloroflexi bacterium]|nr:DUF2281 domain-containing protein [Chloroflexota bacterium]
METADIAREIATLPPEAQRQVFDFIAFLKARYAAGPSARKGKRPQLQDEPFVGMWQGREDIPDSSAWVRRLRDQEWEASQ